VLAHPLVPRYAAEGPEADDRISAAVSRVQASGSFGCVEAGSSSIEELVKSRVHPRGELAPPAEHILCTVLSNAAGTTYFLVNTASKPYAGTCTVRSVGKPVIHVPATGEARPLQQQAVVEACTEFPLTLQPFESLLVVF